MATWRSLLQPALDLIWARQHLDALWQLEEHLGRYAVQAGAGTASSTS